MNTGTTTNNCRYTVSRCRIDNTLVGRLHGSMDGHKTLCGMEINERWWIVNNTYVGAITCPACEKADHRLAEKDISSVLPSAA
jgi:hypothetical protein